MKLQLTQILILLLFIQSAYSQTKTFTISRKDLEVNTCTLDNEANAYYMFEKGYSYIDIEGNFDLMTEYEAKIKILNSEAFDKANVTITLYNSNKSSEDVIELVARTYNLENGKAEYVELKQEHVYRERINDHYTNVKFTLPNLKPGSVIYYKYKIRSPFKFNFNNWRFQDDIPKEYSEFSTKIPAVFKYKVKLVGDLDLESHKSDVQFDCIDYPRIKADCEKNTYIMKDIPAFYEEDFMLSKENYLSQIEFELVSTQWLDGTTYYTKEWKNVDKDLKSNHSIGLELKRASQFKKLLPEAIVSQKKSLTKAKAIYYHLQDHLSWNGNYRIFDDYSTKKVYEKRTGSLVELNAVLLNSLLSQGFDAYPFLLSTRKNGIPTKLFPVVSEFNYVVVKLDLDGKSYLLDVSSKHEKFGDIPFKCLNMFGRVFDFKNGSYWFDIIPQDKLKETKIVNYTFVNDTVKTQIKANANAYYNKSKKIAIKKSVPNFLSYYEKDGVLKITDYSFENIDDPEQPFVESIEAIRVPEVIGNKIFFNPFILNNFDKNPFNLKERRYPVNFGILRSYKNTYIVNIPESYQVTSLPSSKVVKTYDNAVVAKLDIKEVQNKITITFNIDILKNEFSANQYSNLKKIFSEIITIQENSIITLEKK